MDFMRQLLLAFWHYLVGDKMKYDKLFLKCINHTFNLEGGYVNDPRDFGGETYKGVARNAWKGRCAVADKIFKIWDDIKLKLGDRFYNDEFNEIADHNKELQDLVLEFYYVNFWKYLDCNDFKGVHNKVKVLVFDFGVNAGSRTATKCLQRAVRAYADGSFGKGSFAQYEKYELNDIVINFSAERTLMRTKFKSWNDHKLGWLRRDISNLIFAMKEGE